MFGSISAAIKTSAENEVDVKAVLGTEILTNLPAMFRILSYTTSDVLVEYKKYYMSEFV